MIVILFIIAVFISYLFYRKTLPEISKGRRYLLLGLRAIFIFLIILLLFNPILFFERNYTEKPVILLLKDKSNSMEQIIEGKKKSEHLSDFERQIERNANLGNYAFEPIELFSANPDQSFLLDELQAILQSGKEIQALALSSDGWFQDEPSVFRELVNVPIYTFNPEIKNITPEIVIDNIFYNKNARRNETQPIRVSFTSRNLEGDVKIDLKQNNRVVESKEVWIASSPAMTETEGIASSLAMTVDFDVRFTEIGLKVFEIEIYQRDIDNTPNSQLPTPNSAIGYAAIQVLENKSNILILTDLLTWDIRSFSRYINFSDRFDSELYYTHQGQIKQQGKVANVQWQEYAGIIIFNSGNLQLRPNEITAIKNMVLNGKGMIYFGNIHNDLQDLLPARPTNIRIVNEGQPILRPEALSYQIFREIEPQWTKLPPIEYFYMNPKEQTVILAEIHEQQRIPVLFLGNYGSGNVLHFAFKGLWRGQFQIENRYFENFINGLSQWIFTSNNDNFYAYTDKNAFYIGEKITVKLSAFDERLMPLANLNARLELKKDDIIVFSDFLVKTDDIFSINMPELEQGLYKYSIRDDINNKEATGEFEVLEQDIQSLSKGFNQRLLAELSLASGGKNLVASDLTGFHFEKAETSTKIRYIEIPFHKNALFIILLLLCFSIELYLRKKWKLL